MRWICNLTLVGALALSGCAHKNSSSNGENVDNAAAVKDLQSFHLSDPEAPELVDRELNIIPTEVNPMVDKWVNYFQGKGRRHMERYLARSTRYEKLMKKVLRENGLPEDLFYIALIESGFSSAAVSHASAVGYWQFIRGTGSRYGLEISKLVDERRDPVLATQAAADYFKGLYSVFGSWYLAMASYNTGENRVKREVMKHETRDFWELSRRARFPKETMNYVPKFIAAKMIGKDPAKYGFDDIDYLPPIEYDTVILEKPVNMRIMAEKMNYNYEDFKALNPKFKGEIAPLKGDKLDLRIPAGQRELAVAAAADSVPETVEYIADVDTQVYKIRRGDNLSTIARRFRTTVAYLRDLNDIPKGRRLRVGQALYVPDRTPLRDRRERSARTVNRPPKMAPIAAGSAPAASSSAADSVNRFHIVQSGDSLFTIARRYGTTIQELSRLNNLRRGRVLKVGMRLRLPTDDLGSPGKSQNRSAGGQGRMTRPRPRIHVVRAGENLTGIAERYSIEVTALKKRNKIRNPAHIAAGARLIIPPVQAQD
ncbi:MAG: LysM peptidoglycan-binding domain-containing protein [Bdellovibrionaceae bacterium]|nr:LysM peptidoglycan-binding domain-containing protein [Pseudobdellovibrionaceae bacterium]MBX3034194.1 LysM peptidoglycan-binding domain-containing protein [Pseudobdellovibrionaceae bacterium]